MQVELSVVTLSILKSLNRKLILWFLFSSPKIDNLNSRFFEIYSVNKIIIFNHNCFVKLGLQV